MAYVRKVSVPKALLAPCLLRFQLAFQGTTGKDGETSKDNRYLKKRVQRTREERTQHLTKNSLGVLRERQGAQCFGLAISALRKLRQKGCEFQASLSYLIRPCPKEKKKGGGGVNVGRDGRKEGERRKENKFPKRKK